MTERCEEFTVTFGIGVADVMRRAETMIHDARQCASGFRWAKDLGIDDDDAEAWRQKYAEVNKWADEMRVSWYRCFTVLIMLASNPHEGSLQISWDSLRSLLFRQPRSGYHGGLIYHPRYADGKCRRRLKTGRPATVEFWTLPVRVVWA